jgi:hypothetical protein
VRSRDDTRVIESGELWQFVDLSQSFFPADRKKPGATPGSLQCYVRQLAALLELEHLHGRRAEYGPDLGAFVLRLAGRSHGSFNLLFDRVPLFQRPVQGRPVLVGYPQQQVRIGGFARLNLPFVKTRMRTTMRPLD